MSEAETQEMTKLLEVISVTDSEVSTTGGSCVVSPCDVATVREAEEKEGQKMSTAKTGVTISTVIWE